MPDSPPPPHDFKDHKKHMQWQVESRRHSDTVPMIPQDFSQGSHSKKISGVVLQRAIANPLVPLGMVATVGCLVGIMKSIMKRDSNKAQLYMRGRCLAQGFTVAALVGGALLFGIKPDGVGVPADRSFDFSQNVPNKT